MHVKTIPTEHEEQKTLIEWAELQRKANPELKMLYAIPNGGHRNKIVATKLKAEGVKSGVPDMCLPVPRGGYHGLYIELKRLRGGRVSAEQKIWIDCLEKQGYQAIVCNGWFEARTAILDYLEGAQDERLDTNTYRHTERKRPQGSSQYSGR